MWRHGFPIIPDDADPRPGAECRSIVQCLDSVINAASLLQQVVGSNPEAHFDQVAQNASTAQLGAGLAAAMRSEETPPSRCWVARLWQSHSRR
jgi:hypothetical protein